MDIAQAKDLSLDVTLEQYTRKGQDRKVYVLRPDEPWKFSGVVIDTKNEGNDTLLSKISDSFKVKKDVTEVKMFDLVQRKVKYSFSVYDLMKILSRNPSVESYGKISELFYDDPNTQRVDG